MLIVRFDCLPLRSHQFEMVDEYRKPKYQLISELKNPLVLKVYSCLASGQWYTDGSAEIKNEGLYLTCNSVAGETIAFELEPWEITYSITFSDEYVLNRLYFKDELLTELNR